jgi:4-carboxymuconolactone decarboxylase
VYREKVTAASGVRQRRDYIPKVPDLLIPRAALVPGEPTRYTGGVRVAPVAGSEDKTVRLYQVLFAPGARTVWHAHSGEQVLLALDGPFIVQVAGRPAQYVAEGHAARIPPGRRHWHGALPDHEACHLAVNIACTTEWFEPVSDHDYAGAAQHAGAPGS